jgi:hypothetical protein
VSVLPTLLVLKVSVVPLSHWMVPSMVMLLSALSVTLAVESASSTVYALIVVEVGSFCPPMILPPPVVPITSKVAGSSSRLPVLPPGAVRSTVPVKPTV